MGCLMCEQGRQDERVVQKYAVVAHRDASAILPKQKCNAEDEDQNRADRKYCIEQLAERSCFADFVPERE